MATSFEEQYKKLNKAQKEAVETLSGPVMVVAGPGTGKTQVLALRIANILKKTDIKPDGVLCLTFTNSAVEAMRGRLKQYIGETGEKVNVSTFHSFGMKIIEEYYKVLGLATTPKLLEDMDRAILFDEILNGNDWKYLRPRSDSTRYYADLKSIISLLKRERITSEYFLSETEEETKSLEDNPESLSTRGESKGKLKKEILNKIEGLKRTEEVVRFIVLYEEAKKDKNVLDYDDVLENMVRIVEISDDAASSIRERYLYVLVDEHQDSSRVQNEFLAELWGEVEDPDIFVVGDDRQLIYGFSGASIEHFAGFQKTFPKAKLITLVDNYRSTQVILDASHELLESVMSDKKLVSQNTMHHKVRLIDVESPNDEIVSCVLDIKSRLDEVDINDCAILVPKNKQVRSALEILHSMGLPVASLEALNFFDLDEAQTLLGVLKIISNPKDGVALARSFFDPLTGITPIEAHKYISTQNMKTFSLAWIVKERPATLFAKESAVEKWIENLLKWQKDSQNNNLSTTIKIITEELFGETVEQRGKLVSAKEILDTLLVLVLKEEEKNPRITIAEFNVYIDRLKAYGENLPLVVPDKRGVKVLTLHSSKGLEFDYVWIAHMDEWSLSGSRRGGFVLPESIAQKIEERDVEAIKRKLYVAITRAKRFCSLSYARNSHRETEQELASVIVGLPEEVFEKKSIMGIDKKSKTKNNKYLSELTKLVAKEYGKKYVSASLLNNFFECPWKWYFMNFLKLPSEPAETLEFGSAVHTCLDGVLKLSHEPKDAEVEKIIQDSISQIHIKDERSRERITKEVETLVRAWVKNRLPEIKLSRKTEENISVVDKRFSHLKIYGKIDLIENLDKKEVRITDFKTGSVRKKSDIEKLSEDPASGGASVRMSGNLRQLAMYSYLLKQNLKWSADVRESRLEFLEAKDSKEMFYDRVITEEDTALLVQDIIDYDELVKSGKWPLRECHYNSYGKNTECGYCKLAEIYE